MAVALAAQVRGSTVTATIDPADISLGDSTQLTVTVSGGASQPTVPRIDGLEIIGVGESTQISIVNGSMTQNSSRTYSVTPQREGTFTIPALQSDNARSQALTLHVAVGAAGAAQSTQPQSTQITPGGNPVVMPPPQNANPAPQPPEVDPGKIGTMEITLPKKEFYDGELAPIEIRALISGQVNVDRVEMPVFTSDGFTLNTLGKPEQTQRYIDGRPYYVLTWRSAVTAVKPGNFTLNIEMPMSVIVRQQMPDMNDPDAMQNFMRNAFASMQGVRKDVKLTGTSEPLKVLPLPAAGRPANFSGAVGLVRGGVERVADARERGRSGDADLLDHGPREFRPRHQQRARRRRELEDLFAEGEIRRAGQRGLRGHENVRAADHSHEWLANRGAGAVVQLFRPGPQGLRDVHDVADPDQRERRAWRDRAAGDCAGSERGLGAADASTGSGAERAGFADQPH